MDRLNLSLPTSTIRRCTSCTFGKADPQSIYNRVLCSNVPRPFQDAIHAGSANMMCSYQRINNSYGCANSATLNGLLKTELGFQGFVVSDWGAQYTGVATALAGLDVAMPSASSFWGPQLSQAVSNGSVSESRIDDMVTR